MLTTERTPSTLIATSIMRSWSDFSSTLPDKVTTPFCAVTCRSRALMPCSLTRAWRTFSLRAASIAGASALAFVDCEGCDTLDAAEAAGRALVGSLDGLVAMLSRAGSLRSAVLDDRSHAARLHAMTTGNKRTIAFTRAPYLDGGVPLGELGLLGLVLLLVALDLSVFDEVVESVERCADRSVDPGRSQAARLRLKRAVNAMAVARFTAGLLANWEKDTLTLRVSCQPSAKR